MTISDDEIEITTADMLEIVAGGGNGSEYVDVSGLMEKAALELRGLCARAEAAERGVEVISAELDRWEVFAEKQSARAEAAEKERDEAWNAAIEAAANWCNLQASAWHYEGGKKQVLAIRQTENAIRALARNTGEPKP